MKYIIGNWKMNPSNKEEAVRLAQNIELGIKENPVNVEVIVCPPVLYSYAVRMVLNSARLGAQDVASFDAGAHTGQVSAVQLYNMNVGYCIIGHSERRADNHETEVEINAKLKLCLKNKIVPVLCVGAGLKPADNDGKIKSVVRRQFESAVEGVQINDFIVAYEPTWAISAVGHGKMPEPGHVSELSGFIRSLCQEEQIGKISVLYGGNVNSHNANLYRDFVDGYLVGGASLDAHEFVEIIKKFSNI